MVYVMVMEAVFVTLTWASRVTGVTLRAVRDGRKTVWVTGPVTLPLVIVLVNRVGKVTPVIFHNVPTTVTI